MHKYAKKLKVKSEVLGLTHEHLKGSEATLMGVNVKTNSLGFRDEALLLKDSNEYRVVLVGSSITMGWGVERDSVCDLVVERELKNDSLFINVVNTGIGNYNTKLQAIRFDKFIDSLSADMVVLHYFLNDAEEIVSNDQNILIKHSYLAAYIYVKLKQFLVTKSGEFRSIGGYYKNLYSKDSRGWNEAQQSILKMQNKCQSLGVEFILMIQPDLHDLSKESPQFECHRRISDFAVQHNIKVLDLFLNYSESVSLPSEIWVNHDDPHPNAQGHRIIGKALSQYLKAID